jgi:hypothetical protein
VQQPGSTSSTGSGHPASVSLDLLAAANVGAVHHHLHQQQQQYYSDVEAPRAAILQQQQPYHHLPTGTNGMTPYAAAASMLQQRHQQCYANTATAGIVGVPWIYTAVSSCGVLDPSPVATATIRMPASMGSPVVQGAQSLISTDLNNFPHYDGGHSENQPPPPAQFDNNTMMHNTDNTVYYRYY